MFVPGPRNIVRIDATPPFNGTIPNTASFVRNKTLPVGVVVAGVTAPTDAVNVTLSAFVDGFIDETTILVELAGVIVKVPFTKEKP
jgi:hypothetical protein